jgi:hypothetical protein
MNMATKLKLPQFLYVRIEEDGDNSYFVADASVDLIADMGEKRTFGTYKLVETGTVEMEPKITTHKRRAKQA